MEEHEGKINALSLIPSDGGRFEVEIDGKLIYSKLQTDRHAEPGEVKALFEAHIKEG